MATLVVPSRFLELLKLLIRNNFSLVHDIFTLALSSDRHHDFRAVRRPSGLKNKTEKLSGVVYMRAHTRNAVTLKRSLDVLSSPGHHGPLFGTEFRSITSCLCQRGVVYDRRVTTTVVRSETVRTEQSTHVARPGAPATRLGRHCAAVHPSCSRPHAERGHGMIYILHALS